MIMENILTDEVKIYEFKMTILQEKYYNEETSWGVYNFSTEDDIPEYIEYKDPFFGDYIEDAPAQKMSSIVGKMQQLYIGSEYLVKATIEFNQRYNCYQYKPVYVVALTPKDYYSQLVFLQQFSNEQAIKNLLAEYPSIVDDVITGKIKTIEYKKIRGIGEATWNKIYNGIINNYVVSEIIVMLQPLGVTHSMIKRLLSYEPNSSLLKKKLEDNPYIMTDIPGLGFKRVDGLALKINPELRHSMVRLVAFIKYLLYEESESNGHTWLTKEYIDNQISDNVYECQYFVESLYNNNNFLYIENNKVGLKYYRQLELNIFNILVEKSKLNNPKFNFTDDEIEIVIKQAEEEQGFAYVETQRDVIYNTLRNNVSIISGKGGTGKTSTSRAFLKAYLNKNFTISAMALSAKAAQRITEATNLKATTIHRALCAKGLGKFEYNYNNPLPTDVVFIDEASMINAKLFYDVLSAIGEGTRIIIQGDNMQLPPIGAGNIFSDILNRKDIFNSNQLTKVMRQAEKSGILVDANMVRDGINPVNRADLKIVHGELQDMYYMFRNNRETIRDLAIKIYLSSIETDGLDEVAIITPRRKECMNSSIELNKIIEQKLFGNVEQKIEFRSNIFHLGSKVAQTENNYEKNVFNGEIGYITSIYTETCGKNEQLFCEVTFKCNDDIKVIKYAKSEMEQLDLAYAVTVHRFQGSDCKTIIGIIDNTHFSLLDTCMLYTLITRAKKRCCLLAEPQAFLMCLRNNKNINRQTWLKDFVVN